jgi:hypothetical protein
MLTVTIHHYIIPIHNIQIKACDQQTLRVIQFKHSQFSTTTNTQHITQD